MATFSGSGLTADSCDQSSWQTKKIARAARRSCGDVIAKRSIQSRIFGFQGIENGSLGDRSR